MLEKQELHCHNCNNYVQFDIDVEMNGNHVIICPSCKHEHCRVVVDGKITSERWDSRNSDMGWGTYTATNIAYSKISTYTTYIQTNSSLNQPTDRGLSLFTYQAWTNTGQNGTNSSISYTITAV